MLDNFMQGNKVFMLMILDFLRQYKVALIFSLLFGLVVFGVFLGSYLVPYRIVARTRNKAGKKDEDFNSKNEYLTEKKKK